MALKTLGYKTGMVGKWHLSENVDFTSAYTDQQAAVQSAGFDYADGLYIGNLNECSSCTSFTHNMEWMTQKALEFMDGAISASTPFFLYFNPTVPHTPSIQEAVNTGYSSYRSEGDKGTPAGTLSESPSFTAYCTSCKMATRDEVWAASSVFSGDTKRSAMSSVYWIDQAVGVLYDYLTEKDALKNTYIVVLSDNGNAKGTAYEQGTRTMMNARGPTIPAGTVVTDPVMNVDLAPTALEWAGSSALTIGLDTNGVSWAPLAACTSTTLSRSAIFLEMGYDRAVVTPNYFKYYNAGQGDYANSVATSNVLGWYANQGQEHQLYNLVTDGAETTDLSTSDTTTLATMQALMTTHKAATLNKPAAATFDPCISDSSNCRSGGTAHPCCDTSLTCYEKGTYYGQCLSACKDSSWACWTEALTQKKDAAPQAAQVSADAVVPEEDLSSQAQSTFQTHQMPDGSTMLDQDMLNYETKHAPGMHMMQDGHWMKDEKMVHVMPDGAVMHDVDMPSMVGQGLLAVSEDLHTKHKVEARLVQQGMSKGKGRYKGRDSKGKKRQEWRKQKAHYHGHWGFHSSQGIRKYRDEGLPSGHEGSVSRSPRSDDGRAQYPNDGEKDRYTI
jgi:arylsulfatase A-like enzyme